MTLSATMTGEPWPAFVPPCLAKPVAVPPSGEDWLHEIKYDGYRVQVQIQDGCGF